MWSPTPGITQRRVSMDKVVDVITETEATSALIFCRFFVCSLLVDCHTQWLPPCMSCEIISHTMVRVTSHRVTIQTTTVIYKKTGQIQPANQPLKDGQNTP
jgi:hypothetical protein